MDIGSRRIHAHTATAINKLIVGIDGEARAAQTADSGSPELPPLRMMLMLGTDCKRSAPSPAGEGLQSSFGVESNAIGFLLLCAGDGDRGKGNCFFRCRVSLCPCLGYG